MNQLSEQILTLGNAIRFMRERAGLSSRALSAIAGLSPSYVGKVESGDLGPSFDAFCAIVHGLKCTDGEILFLVRMQGKILNDSSVKEAMREM